MVKLVKIEGTEQKGLGFKYNTEDGAWRVIPEKSSTKYAGVGQKRMTYVTWRVIELKGDREFTALSLSDAVAKLEKIGALR